MPTLIEIIAPSSAEPSIEKLNSSIAKANDNGFDVNIAKDLTDASFRYESNSVAYRIDHFNKALSDDKVAVLWALRGGYGSAKLATLIADMPRIIQAKHIIGFSDLTAMFLALNQEHNWLCIHGPGFGHIGKDGEKNPINIDQTIGIIKGKITSLSIPDLIPLNNVTTDDKICGKLIGGNLTLLESSIGTNWQLNCSNKILFFEDVNEAAYRIDRTLTHFQQANIFWGVKAIIIGNIINPKCEVHDKELMNYALVEFAKIMKEQNCPVYKTESFGHYYNNIPLVIGADAEILTDNVNNSVTLNYHWKAAF